MKVYEFGERKKPVILLLPGTCCHWRGNFAQVIEGLEKEFFVACVSYDGFDETENTEFESMLKETRKIESHIIANYGGKIFAAYGCSLGGTFVGLLLARQRVKMKHAIIGSSDFDQSGPIAAWFKTVLLLPIFYPMVHTGKMRGIFLNKWMDKKITEMGAYGEAFKKILCCNGKPMHFVTKKSIKNQYYSDLVTKLPRHSFVQGTQVHILYAEKMGEVYKKRYEDLFKSPEIISIPLRHEELLMLFPEKWVQLIFKLCHKTQKRNEHVSRK